MTILKKCPFCKYDKPSLTKQGAIDWWNTREGEKK